ncbi:lysophospholipid acyltransferase family protein [Actinomycetota bacterium]
MGNSQAAPWMIAYRSQLRKSSHYATAMKVLQGLRTILVAPIFVIGTLLAAAVVALISVVRRDSPLVETIVIGWSRFFVGLAGSRLTVEGVERFDPSGQFLFIANHISNLDIPVMFLATRMPIRYLAKAELFKIPILKQAMDQLGIVRVDRLRGSAIHSEVNTGVAAAQARGHSVIIFPEGTRSENGEMGPFKKGAFRIAIANQLDIVPVTISGTWEAWRPLSKIVMGGPLRAVIHDPIPVAGLDLTDLDDLRTRVHHVIKKEYESLRA